MEGMEGIERVITFLASLTAVVVFVASVVVKVRRLLARRENPADLPKRKRHVDQATQKLAEHIRDHWQEQASHLGLASSKQADAGTPAIPANVMHIAWSVDTSRTSSGLSAATQQRLDAWRRRADSPPGAGVPGVHDLATFYREVHPKVLVVLGTSESGKTAASLLLTLGLLQSRAKDDAVPVHFSLHHWDPGQTFRDWLAERLLEDHPFLRSVSAYGPHAETMLLNEYRVLPILDGLDELPEPDVAGDAGARPSGRTSASSSGARSMAIRAIEGTDLALPGMILTCQQDEYEKIEAHARLTEAVVVALGGLAPEEARRYIEFPETPRFIGRWRPVFDKLSGDRDGDLARALRSPLMTFLITKVYSHGNSEPAELLEEKDEAAIRKRLLTRYVPAVYDEPESTNAQRWLGNLADLMGDRPVIGWWELSAAGRPATQRLAGIVAFLTGSAAVGIAFGVLFNPTVGMVVGLVAGLLLGIAAARNEPPKPSEIQVRFGGRFRAILKSGLAIGVIVFVFGTIVRDVWFGLGAGAIFGFAIGVLYGVTTEPDPTARPVEPRFLLRRDVRVGLTFGLAYGLLAGIVGLWLSGSVVAAILVGVSAALAGALLYGPIWTLQGSNVGVVAFVHLVIATFWFARNGKLPWRIVAFLDGAQERGVIRLSSGKYQFRHPALQEVLAAEARNASAVPGRAIVEPAIAPPDPVTTP